MIDIKTNENELYLAISPELVRKFEKLFLVEMLQGERWESDGLIHFKMTLSDKKIIGIKKWFFETFPKSDKN